MFNVPISSALSKIVSHVWVCGVGLKRGRAEKRGGVGGSLEIRQSLFTMGPEWSEGFFGF